MGPNLFELVSFFPHGWVNKNLKIELPEYSAFNRERTLTSRNWALNNLTAEQAQICPWHLWNWTHRHLSYEQKKKGKKTWSFVSTTTTCVCIIVVLFLFLKRRKMTQPNNYELSSFTWTRSITSLKCLFISDEV